MRFRWSFHLAAVLLAGFLASVPAIEQESKQDKKAEAQLRTVRGGVLDKDENPTPGSVVYLVNVKSQAVKTLFADDSGRYRFSGLDPNVDYEIHAEHGDMMSATRTVSSYDTRRDIEVTLKLTRKKPAR
ncbi:MAG: carboxypeptidase-like regulatory domain-containing protein [Candidatus Acidiferrales bacterium]